MRSIGKVASNTMAATVISAVLVGGYVLFGLFSKPPGAAEIATDEHRRRKLAARRSGCILTLTSCRTNARSPTRGAKTIDRRSRRDIGGCARSERGKRRFRSAVSNRSRHSSQYNLAVQYYPRFAAANFDRGIVLIAIGDFDRPFDRRRRGQAHDGSEADQRSPRRCRASRCRSCRLLRLLRRQTGECRSPRP